MDIGMMGEQGEGSEVVVAVLRAAMQKRVEMEGRCRQEQGLPGLEVEQEIKRAADAIMEQGLSWRASSPELAALYTSWCQQNPQTDPPPPLLSFPALTPLSLPPHPHIGAGLSPLRHPYLLLPPHLYLFNSCFLPLTPDLHLTYILSQLDMGHLFTYFQLCIKVGKPVPIITTEPLWDRVRGVVGRVLGDGAVLVRVCPADRALGFEFAGSSVVFREGLWLWGSWDVVLQMKGDKYVVPGYGIRDEGLIFKAKQSKLITQQQYEAFLDRSLYCKVAWGLNYSQVPSMPIKQAHSHYLTPNMLNFTTFSECLILSRVPKDILKQIYANGEIRHYQQGEAIYKQLTNLEYFYIVLEGQVAQCNHSSQLRVLGPSDFYSLASVVGQGGHEKCSLVVASQAASVFVIAVKSLCFLLGHYTREIVEIANIEMRADFLVELEGMSELEKKFVKRDSIEHQHHSQRTTATICEPGVKISKALWQKLCRKNIQISFRTRQPHSPQ